MRVSVIDYMGKDTGRQVDLSDSVFGIEPNEHAIYLDVKQYLANRRQGTHKTKERGEVSGSTRKIKKQKGTGSARAGSIKSPLFRGGGVVFGPKPRSYSFKLNKNLKKLARRSAFSLQARDKNIIILENFSFEIPKTKRFIEVLNSLNLHDEKSLFVFESTNKNVYLSSRNLERAETINISALNTYNILNTKKIVLLEGVIPIIESNLNRVE